MQWWGEALQTATYLLNRSGSRTRSYKTPYELWTGRRPSVDHLRVFGSVAYVHVPKVQRKKLEPKSIKCLFVGYCTDTKAYRLWDPKRRRIIVSRDVIFDEYTMPKTAASDAISGLFTLQLVGSAPNNDSTGCPQRESPSSRPSITEFPQNSPAREHDHDDDPSANGSIIEAVQSPVSQPCSPRQTRLRGPPARLADCYVPHSFAGAVNSVTIPDDPESYQEAMRGPQADEWTAAMRAEYNSLMQAHTWKLVPLPAGRKAVKCKWIFRVKTNPDGSIAKYKARLVAQGCTQTKGIDYDQMFSPVVKYDAVRTVLGLAAQQAMYLTQFDIQTAFLNGLIDTVLFMIQPPGFEEVGPNDTTLVCLILRSLYGFKQSGRIWNQTFNDFLVKFELEPTAADPCVMSLDNSRIY